MKVFACIHEEEKKRIQEKNLSDCVVFYYCHICYLPTTYRNHGV